MAEERTIEEWLQELPDGYRELALENREKFQSPFRTTNSLYYAIQTGFAWGKTPEGYSFWKDVLKWAAEGFPLPPLPAQKKQGGKVYIAGPMRGHDCYNFEQFFFWAHILKKGGYEVVNPAQRDVEKMLKGWGYTDEQYAQILAEDIVEISKCTGIFLLRGWEKSDGANAEYAFAKAIKLEIMKEEDRV